MIQAKAFCPNLYRLNNRPGIETALSLLNQFGYNTIENGYIESYSDRDAIVNDGEVNFKIEAEKSNIWTTADSYPFQYVRVPYRKHKSNAYFYVMTNRDMTACLITKMDIVKRSQAIITQCRGIPHPEEFFIIPITTFDWYIKSGSKWQPHSNTNDYVITSLREEL